MALVARGIVWFSLYLFLILLPLITAVLAAPQRVAPPFLVEVAVGAGFVGLSIMCLEFALISRLKTAAQAFGQDALQLFHNLMGMVALGFLLAHPLLLIFSGYPANCWLNPFAACGNVATRTASMALYVLVLLVVLSIVRNRLRIRYETWQVTHGLFSLFVLLAAMVHIFILGRYTTTPIMKAVWLVYATLVTCLLLWYKIVQPILYWNKKWEVVENREERGEARTLVLKPVGHKGFSFEPGQFAWIKTGSTAFNIGAHPISMSSGGDVEPGGKVAFTIKDLGDWSGTEVPALKAGDTAWLDGPHGVFSMDREQAMGYVFIGGGVGITPLYSMLQTMVGRGDVRPVTLFYGGDKLENLTFREELDALTEELNLEIIYVLTQPDESWEGETGYIRAEVLRRHAPPQVRRFKFFICGPAALMDSMEETLVGAGIAPEQVHSERFDMV